MTAKIFLYSEKEDKKQTSGGLQLVSLMSLLLLTAVNVTVSSNKKSLCDHKKQSHTQQINMSIHHMEVETDQRSLNHRGALCQAKRRGAHCQLSL